MPRKNADNRSPRSAKHPAKPLPKGRTSAGNVKCGTVFLPSENAQIEAYARDRAISKSAALRELTLTGLHALRPGVAHADPS